MKKKSANRDSPLNEERTFNLLAASAAAATGAAAVNDGEPADSAAHDESGGRKASNALKAEASGSFPDVEDSRVADEQASRLASEGAAVPSSLRGRPAVRGGKEGGGKRSAVRRRLSWQAGHGEGEGEEGSDGVSGEERDPMTAQPCGSGRVREQALAAADGGGNDAVGGGAMDGWDAAASEGGMDMASGRGGAEATSQQATAAGSSGAEGTSR